MYIVRKGESEEDFFEREDADDDEYFRASLVGVGFLSRVLNAAGAFEQVDPWLFAFQQGDLVTPKDCRFIAERLAPLDSVQALQTLREGDDDYIRRFRAYCERAAGQGGFRIC
jgi:hypothetical protein